MAVVFLFIFASLTDGRTVRDLPKQHREKELVVLLFCFRCVVCFGRTRTG